MRTINILLIIILITGVILGIKIYKSNTESKYSIQDIQAILDKANDITNYECDIENNYGGVKYYKRLNSKVYFENDDGSKGIIDYNKNTYISYIESTKYYVEGKPFTDYIITSNYYTGGIEKNNITTIEGFAEIVSAKEEKYKENKCLKVEVKKEIMSSYNNIIIWINMDNGLIMKKECLYDNIDDEIYEYTYKFNTVTYKDVNPDLSEYKRVESN